MSDLINRQAAIDALDCISGVEEVLRSLPSAQPEPHDLVSRRAALEAMDTWDKFGCDPDGKLVRYDDDKHYMPYVHYEDMVHAVKNLLPAQPEHKVRFADKDHVWIDGKQYISLPRFQEAVKEAQPKEGHWIEVAGELECSECHTVFTDLYPDYADSVACPHCGAKMKGEEE